MPVLNGLFAIFCILSTDYCLQSTDDRSVLPQDTSTHQDHVIAHVLGATPLGYFIFDEALYILLDIGFVWTILLDGEMGLLPHPVAASELEIDEAIRQQIKSDIDFLLNDQSAGTTFLTKTSSAQPIADVALFSSTERRRLIVKGETATLVVETNLATREIKVMTVEENDSGATGPEEELHEELGDLAAGEHDYLHRRLREELGREPTEAELDEWLRQHTEGY